MHVSDMIRSPLPEVLQSLEGGSRSFPLAVHTTLIKQWHGFTSAARTCPLAMSLTSHTQGIMGGPSLPSNKAVTVWMETASVRADRMGPVSK